MKIVQVDAFTNQPFQGNPAGVCILDAPADPVWMQNVALEMNVAETAFVVPQADGFDLRWFTPTVEVDLCGHATLASAHVLWQDGHLAAEQPARFHTRSGLLIAKRQADWIELDFPAEPANSCELPPELIQALNVTPINGAKNRFDYVVEVESEAIVRGLKPDFNLLATLPARGVIVTSRSDSREYDFVSRYFAPAYGINEDPATGSTHCCLGPYWREPLGRNQFLAYQASTRGGIIRVRVSENGKRVYLAGQAVTVMRADFLI